MPNKAFANKMRIASFFAFLTALATPFILFPKHEAGWASPSELLAGLLFWPVMITSVILIILSICLSPLKRPLGAVTLTFCLALVFPVSLLARITTLSISKAINDAESARRENWYQYDTLLLPKIISYVVDYPERVSYPYKDDRAEIQGLGNYLRNQGVTVSTKENDIIDPWGNPIWVIMDHDNDMQLKFEGHFYGVWTSKGNKIVVALLTRHQYSLSDSSNAQWQLDGGQIENK
jgi:hypothetical protein